MRPILSIAEDMMKSAGILASTFVSATLFLSAGLQGCDKRLPAEAPEGGEGWPGVKIVKVVDGLREPTHVAHAGDGSGRLFVVEKAGRIRVYDKGSLLATPFLDITSRVKSSGYEQGLFSVAFPPDYRKKGRFYVNYTGKYGETVVARYHRAETPVAADPGSEEVILTVAQPYANHNGGQLAFGPDGYLYIGMGDGGSGGDPRGHGQNRRTLLGAMLRIDVESARRPFAVPAGNPHAEKPGARPEIWATGLRNPWRFSFDRQTGDLYIADVGQNRYEEVNVQPAGSGGGENYGWNIMEGMHCYRKTPCEQEGLTPPVAEYTHAGGNCSVTGGMVHRGAAHPALNGIYLYADFCSGRLWGLRKKGDSWESALLLETGLGVSTFGEDEDGNVYLADFQGGALYRIETK
jgi:glucose/arabinose dehydrogenase